MIPIYVDLSEVLLELNLSVKRSEELASFVLDELSQRYAKEWESVVTKNLRKERADYIRAMSYDRISSTEAIFKLNSSPANPVPMMIEVGCSPFDQKIGFSKSPSRTEKKNGGWYVTIPFRFASSEALAEAGVFSNSLPKQIEELSKQNKGRPLLQRDLPKPYNTVNQRDIIDRMNVRVEAYKHKVSIYAGLVRKDISSTVNEKRGGYYTFRRVSDKSDPLSWWHPGFTARNFMQRALDNMNVQTTVAMAIDKFFEK